MPNQITHNSFIGMITGTIVGIIGSIGLTIAILVIYNPMSPLLIIGFILLCLPQTFVAVMGGIITFVIVANILIPICKCIARGVKKTYKKVKSGWKKLKSRFSKK